MSRITLAMVVLFASSALVNAAHAHGGAAHGGGGGGGAAHAAAPHPIAPHAAASHAAAHHAAASHSAAQRAAHAHAGNPHSPKGSKFAKEHPRRDEVNNRVAKQRSRIEQGLKSGKLTPAEAKQLMANDKSIKQQEHADVRANGGHLTKAEQKQFNQDEHANSTLIRNDIRPASTAKAVPAVASRPGNPVGAPGSRFAEHHPRRDEVNRREGDQRARIEEGLRSGKLTPAEAKQLMANDKSIKQQEHADVRANGGYLTKSEQRQFNQEENANSRLIRNDEHPATSAKAVPAAASRPGNPIGAPGSRFAEHHPRRDEVNRREADQRARIEEGLRSGKLTPAEAKQLLSNDKSIKQQEHADVRANGGYLTKAEQRQFNQEEHANSTLIRDDLHPAAR